MSAIYGLNLQTVTSNNNSSTSQDEVEFANAARKVVDLSDQLILPGGNTYKSIPFIQYLYLLTPSDFSDFSRMEDLAKRMVRRLKNEPFEASMKAWVRDFFSSFSFSFLEYDLSKSCTC
jgi:hypothetical protein